MFLLGIYPQALLGAVNRTVVDLVHHFGGMSVLA
jgi:hypothetical protein